MINWVRNIFYNYFSDKGTKWFEYAVHYYCNFPADSLGFQRGEICFRLGILCDEVANLFKSKG